MQTLSKSISEFLNKPYSLTSEQIEFYQKNRYIKLKEVLNQETTEFLTKLLQRK